MGGILDARPLKIATLQRQKTFYSIGTEKFLFDRLERRN
jgi:hypothetical protein